jgi:hypothetical protein
VSEAILLRLVGSGEAAVHIVKALLKGGEASIDCPRFGRDEILQRLPAILDDAHGLSCPIPQEINQHLSRLLRAASPVTPAVRLARGRLRRA